MKRAVLLDLDGTLADCSHRINKAKNPETGKMDWKIFYSGMENDSLVLEVRSLARTFENTGHVIIILTGRPEEYRRDTEAWLHHYEVDYSRLFMREDSDRRPAPTYKKSVYQNIISETWDVVAAIDDDVRVAKMYQELNIPCIVPASIGHIQQSFDSLDMGAVQQLADDVATAHITKTILQLDDSGCPGDTKVKWLREYSVGLARAVAKAVQG